MGKTKVGFIDFGNYPTHGIGLPVPVAPHQNLSFLSPSDIVVVTKSAPIVWGWSPEGWYFDLTSLNLLSVILLIMIASSAFFYLSILP